MNFFNNIIVNDWNVLPDAVVNSISTPLKDYQNLVSYFDPNFHESYSTGKKKVHHDCNRTEKISN